MGTDMATTDEEQVAELLGRFVNDLGATASAGNALGNQAGETAIADVVEAAEFRTFRRVAETPFNLVYEARP